VSTPTPGTKRCPLTFSPCLFPITSLGVPCPGLEDAPAVAPGTLCWAGAGSIPLPSPHPSPEAVSGVCGWVPSFGIRRRVMPRAARTRSGAQTAAQIPAPRRAAASSARQQPGCAGARAGRGQVGSDGEQSSAGEQPELLGWV